MSFWRYVQAVRRSKIPHLRIGLDIQPQRWQMRTRNIASLANAGLMSEPSQNTTPPFSKPSAERYSVASLSLDKSSLKPLHRTIIFKIWSAPSLQSKARIFEEAVENINARAEWSPDLLLVYLKNIVETTSPEFRRLTMEIENAVVLVKKKHFQINDNTIKLLLEYLEARSEKILGSKRTWMMARLQHIKIASQVFPDRYEKALRKDTNELLNRSQIEMQNFLPLTKLVIPDVLERGIINDDGILYIVLSILSNCKNRLLISKVVNKLINGRMRDKYSIKAAFACLEIIKSPTDAQKLFDKYVSFIKKDEQLCLDLFIGYARCLVRSDRLGEAMHLLTRTLPQYSRSPCIDVIRKGICEPLFEERKFSILCDIIVKMESTPSFPKPDAPFKALAFSAYVHGNQTSKAWEIFLEFENLMNNPLYFTDIDILLIRLSRENDHKRMQRVYRFLREKRRVPSFLPSLCEMMTVLQENYSPEEVRHNLLLYLKKYPNFNLNLCKSLILNLTEKNFLDFTFVWSKIRYTFSDDDTDELLARIYLLKKSPDSSSLSTEQAGRIFNGIRIALKHYVIGSGKLDYQYATKLAELACSLLEQNKDNWTEISGSSIGSLARQLAFLPDIRHYQLFNKITKSMGCDTELTSDELDNCRNFFSNQENQKLTAILCNHQATSGQIHSKIEKMINAGCPPDIDLFLLALRVLVVKGTRQEYLDVFTHAKSLPLRFKDDMRLCNEAVPGLFKFCCHDTIYSILENASQDRAFIIREGTLKKVIKSCDERSTCSMEDMSVLLKLLKLCEVRNVQIFELMTKQLCKEGQKGKLLELLSLAESEGVELCDNLYSRWLLQYMHRGNTEEARQLIRKRPSIIAQLSVTHLNQLLLICMKDSVETEFITEIIDHIKKKHGLVHRTITEEAIKRYSQVSLELVNTLWSLCSQKFLYDKEQCELVIMACSTSNNDSEAFQNFRAILNIAKKFEIAIGICSLNKVAENLIKTGYVAKIQRFENFFQETHQFVLNTRLRNMMIKAFFAQKDAEGAEKVFNAMAPPALAKKSYSIENIFDMMSMAVERDRGTYDEMIKGLQSLGLEERAERYKKDNPFK